MTRVKIRHYVVKGGKAFWQPTPKMKALGFHAVPLGQDGTDAWATAERWNERWDKTKDGEAPSPAMVANLSPERAEELTVYPPRSLGDAFARYRRTREWSKKAPRTREEWFRAWKWIKPVFGDCAPRTARLEDVSRWREVVEDTVSLREAHRCPQSAMVRGRGRARGQAGLAHGLLWARGGHRSRLGYAAITR